MIGTASPRPRSATFEGHEHARWEPATPLSDEDKRKVARIELGRTDVDFKLKQRLDDLLKELEGDLVPVCTCGWRGLPGAGSLPTLSDPQWQPPANLARTQRPHGPVHPAVCRGRAAAALIHAAEAWTGEEDVAQWQRARAEHILNVGLYDGELWP